MALTIDGIEAANKASEISVIPEFPIGWTYWQFPGKASPIDMGLPGTWEIISGPGKDFDGIFPSIEGTGRAAFDGTIQPDQMQRITGQFEAVRYYGGRASVKNAQGAFSDIGNGPAQVGMDSDGTQVSDYIGFDSANSPGARTGDKTYPENVCIRLWERTA